jgi:membrane peptidoglycan carboxypeptidase
MRKRDHNLLTNGVSLLICGLLAGVVVAAAAFPAVAMSGLAAKTGAEAFEQLPSELKDQRAPQVSRIFANDGRTPIAIIWDEFRSDQALKDISPWMQKAIIAAEDHEFYHHNGVDLKGVARAFVANNGGKQTQQGASTLTMQYVRMSIAYSATHPQDVVDATKDTPKRKITEMRYAMQIEKELTKDQILERYLNIAPFGNGAYGVLAASQIYFNKKPKDLNIEESALLAGLVKAPSGFNPTTTSGYPDAVDRRAYVIDNMVTTGAITKEQATAAKATKISHTVNHVGNGCVSVPKNNWGFFCDYFMRWWNNQEAFGPTTYDRESRLKRGGYNIVTTLDVKVQKAASDNIEKQYKTSKNHPHALMEAAIQPGTGYVAALAVNRKFKLDDPDHPQNGPSSDPKKKGKGTYPNTTNPLLSGGGDITGYQAGSTFKMFTMVTALAKGYPLGYTINTKGTYKSKYLAGYGNSSACPGSDKWCPSNSGKGDPGVLNMWSAFGRSINTFFVPLEERVGADEVVKTAEAMGIKFRSAEDQNNTSPDHAAGFGSFTLGVTLTTPLDLANAYSTLAADGKACEALPVKEIRDHDGTKLDVASPRCKQVIPVDVARAALDAARCPVGGASQYGKCTTSGTAPGAAGEVGHPVFGKTGTTDGNKTAVLVVGTKSLVVGGILGDPDWAASTYQMEHPIVNGAVIGTLADAMKGQPKESFEKPSNKMAYGESRSVPGVKCDSVDSARSQLEGSGFVVDVDSTQVDSDCPAGQVAGTNPDGSTIKGGSVTIEVSNGKGKAVPPPGQQPPGTKPGRPGNGGPGNGGFPGN